MSVSTAGRRARPAFPAALLSSVLSAVLAFGLSACGVGAGNSGGVGDARETSFDTALDALPKADAVPPAADARDVSFAGYVGDVTPVTTDAAPALPVNLTDADGEDVTVTDVSRIVPLDISGTISRTLAGLGLRDNIVGRSVSSMEPSLADLPVVTHGGHSISAEAVLNLDPTLIILNDSIGPEDAVQQIRDAGVPVVKLEDPEYTEESVRESITTVADVVGLSGEGRTLADRAADEADRARSAIGDLASGATGGTPLPSETWPLAPPAALPCAPLSSTPAGTEGCSTFSAPTPAPVSSSRGSGRSTWPRRTASRTWLRRTRRHWRNLTPTSS